MRGNLAGAVWRLAVFMAVCVLGVFVLLAVFAQLRFEKQLSYSAVFVNASGLKGGDLVRVAGVEVGKVDAVTMTAGTDVLVEFWTDESVVLTEGSRAVIRYADLIGGRYLELEEGAGGT
ncbi:MAG TPA: MlaD family protein, partial [Mycobacterium sp.]